METSTYIVHYFNDPTHLFTTVTMYPEHERSRIYNAIVQNTQWCSWRYTAEQRTQYMLCRTAVESMLYHDFTSQYWALTDTHPVYFYTIHETAMKRIEGERRKRIAKAPKNVIFGRHFLTAFWPDYSAARDF